MSRTHWFPVQLSFLNLMVLFVLPLMSAITCTNQPIFKQYGIKSQLAVARYLNVAVFKLAFLQLELDPDFWYLTLFHTNNNISKAKYSTGEAFAALKPLFSSHLECFLKTGLSHYYQKSIAIVGSTSTYEALKNR